MAYDEMTRPAAILKSQIIKVEGQVCVRCDRDHIDGTPIGRAITLDHIHERQDGGADEKSNAQLLCEDCHEQKTLLFQQKRKELRRALTFEESLALNQRFIAMPKPIRTRTEAYDFLRKAESPYLNSGRPLQFTRPVMRR